MRLSAKILAVLLFITGYQAFSQNSLDLNGINQWAAVSTSPDIELDSAFTIEAWVRPTAVTGRNVVLSKSTAPTGPYGYMIFLDTLQERITARVGDAAFEVSADSAWELNEWVHIGLTHTGAELALYVDGSQVATASSPPNAQVTIDSLRIGAVVGGDPGDPFQGQIDDVRFRNSTQSADLIGATMFDEAQGIDLVTYFTFDEGAGFNSTDQGVAGGQANFANLMGGAGWSANEPFPPSVPNTIFVTNSNDAGTASLREAIALANIYSGSDTVTIQFSTGDTISISSPLPRSLATPKRMEGGDVTIDGNGAQIFTNSDYLEVHDMRLTNATGGLLHSSGGARSLVQQSAFINCSVRAIDAGQGQIDILQSSFVANNIGIFSDGISVIENSTFAQNSNGAEFFKNSNHTVTNCTFANNTNYGVRIDSSAAASTIRNSIFFNNTTNDIAIFDLVAPTNHPDNFASSCAGQCPGGYDGSVPMLEGSLSTCSGIIQYYELQSGSPAIGAADPGPAPAVDICGNLRDGSPDAGASEFSGGPGPGPAGYSFESPTFSYSPLGATTSVFLADDSLSGAIPLGFSFEFFDNTYDTVYIASDGFLTFFQQPVGVPVQGIPSPSAPNGGLIAGFWGDLDPTMGGSIFYETIGSSPARTFVV
ncbi:MAG: LamG-like jellyroll fold domain-containing protein, partial [Bacteroidota bacterium]